VVVKPDDTVVIRIARSEMGQGTLTGLAQLVAEELECNWAKVTTEYPTPGQNLARKRVWGNFSTGGSRGIRESHDYVRKGGAAARMMLVQAAANEWKVPVAECRAANSVITHAPSGRTVTYGKVAAAAGKLQPPADVTLKDPKDWKIVGKRLARLDTVDKVTGKQVYGADLKLPGMLNAAIKDCPVFGGKVKSFNAAAIPAAPASRRSCRWATAPSPWWPTPGGAPRPRSMPCPSNGTRARTPRSPAPRRRHAEGRPRRARGGRRQPERRRQGGAGLGHARGRGGVLVSAPEPRDHGADERHGALDAGALRGLDADAERRGGAGRHVEAAGLPAAQCEVYKIHLGGGFGRRGAVHDWVRQAVDIAKEMPGTPVKLLWTREEDMLHGRYHPSRSASCGGLDAQGNVTALHMRISGQSILAGIAPQNIKDGRTRWCSRA
jgi:isoquinoline 1-oxidoreductase beta subunit